MSTYLERGQLLLSRARRIRVSGSADLRAATLCDLDSIAASVLGTVERQVRRMNEAAGLGLASVPQAQPQADRQCQRRAIQLQRFAANTVTQSLRDLDCARFIAARK